MIPIPINQNAFECTQPELLHDSCDAFNRQISNIYIYIGLADYYGMDKIKFVQQNRKFRKKNKMEKDCTVGWSGCEQGMCRASLVLYIWWFRAHNNTREKKRREIKERKKEKEK